MIDKIPRNKTSRHSITIAGSNTLDGRCSGSQYSDTYGSWDNVVVQASVKIILQESRVPVRRSTNQVMLPSGERCDTTPGYCYDQDGGESYWKNTPSHPCDFEQYDVLYEGSATKLTSKESHLPPIVYTVTSQEVTFGLTKTKETNLCGHKLLHTEHPKLFIMETTQGRVFKSKNKIPANNLDIFSYVNSKFVYVEKHMKTQLNAMYKDIMEQKCAIEKQVLENALSLAAIAPDEVASKFMKAPGYTAVIAGDVIHLIKCMPVECRVRHTEQCFNELPVTYKNTSMFILPRSRIITTAGTPRDCNGLLPTLYKLHDTWFRVDQKPVETMPPQIIKPLTQPKWKYYSPEVLASSGIYSNEDLERFKDLIMFPVERPNTLHNLARGARGQPVPLGSISIKGLLDEDSLNKIAENAGKRIWSGFVSFGSASAGILGIFIVIRVAKLIIDTLIHGYALHSIYGWSIHLIGAIWSSVTYLLLHLGRPNSAKEKENRQLEQVTTELFTPPTTQPLIIEQPPRPLPNQNHDVTPSNQTHPHRELRQLLNSEPRNNVP